MLTSVVLLATGYMMFEMKLIRADNREKNLFEAFYALRVSSERADGHERYSYPKKSLPSCSITHLIVAVKAAFFPIEAQVHYFINSGSNTFLPIIFE